jgi:hypothetical protein
MPRAGMAVVGALAMLVVGLGAPRSGHAQSDVCDGRFHDGVESRRAGRDAEALEHFRQSWEGCHRPRARVQMAWAYQALGRWADAATHLGEALQDRDDPWVEARRAQLEVDLRVMDGHVGRLEITGGVPGAQVHLDGAAVATLPLRAPLRWAAGDAQLEVRVPGRRPWAGAVSLAPGVLTRQEVELPAEPFAVLVLAPSAPGPRRSALRHALGVGAGVAAGVVLAGAAVAYGYGFAQVAAYNGEGLCPGVEAAEQPEPCGGWLRTSRAMETTSLVGLGVGVALAVTGVVLLVTERNRTAEAAPRAAFACGGGPGVLGIGCGATF